jgi:transcriptional regulator with XRE-family HTH domain
MDDLAVGRVFRALRFRLGWTQSMAAAKAGISRSSYSEVERGWIDRVSIGKLRKIAAIYEVRLVLEPRWRGAALDRAFSSRHAAMAEEVTRLLVGLVGRYDRRSPSITSANVVSSTWSRGMGRRGQSC